MQLICPYPCSDSGGHKQLTTINKSGSERLGGSGSSDTRTTAATTANGTMALIAATTTTAAAVATVAAMAAEVWRRRGRVRRDGCVGCCQMVVARKSQKPFGDFTQQRDTMFLTRTTRGQGESATRVDATTRRRDEMARGRCSERKTRGRECGATRGREDETVARQETTQQQPTCTMRR